MELLCCPALSHLPREESTLSGDDSSCPGEDTWEVSSGLDSKYLGAWKGPHLFGCILSHFLHSEFLQGKGDGGKTTGRASLPPVRKVIVKLTWALLGDVPEPREASSLVLPLTYLQWDCIQIHIHFGLEIIQKAWPFLLSQGFSLRTRNMPT